MGRLLPCDGEFEFVSGVRALLRMACQGDREFAETRVVGRLEREVRLRDTGFYATLVGSAVTPFGRPSILSITS